MSPMISTTRAGFHTEPFWHSTSPSHLSFTDRRCARGRQGAGACLVAGDRSHTTSNPARVQPARQLPIKSSAHTRLADGGGNVAEHPPRDGCRNLGASWDPFRTLAAAVRFVAVNSACRNVGPFSSNATTSCHPSSSPRITSATSTCKTEDGVVLEALEFSVPQVQKRRYI